MVYSSTASESCRCRGMRALDWSGLGVVELGYLGVGVGGDDVLALAVRWRF